jgi:hypothetical protein
MKASQVARILADHGIALEGYEEGGDRIDGQVMIDSDRVYVQVGALEDYAIAGRFDGKTFYSAPTRKILTQAGVDALVQDVKEMILESENEKRL